MDNEKLIVMDCISLPRAVNIVKNGLDDESIQIAHKVRAIERVAEMETHNGITKDELVRCLRFIFDHYEMEV